jgi:predicted kinase
MLIVFGGLPGTGKTTLARELSRRLSATYLRIDTLEQAIQQSRIAPDAGPSGYIAGYAVAADNLALGLTVVADSVNALTITRDSWIAVAQQAGSFFAEVETVCSDKLEHRRRVEMREPDIPGHVPPAWQDVVDRQYETWPRKHIVIDTAALPVPQAIDELVRQLSAIRHHRA